MGRIFGWVSLGTLVGLVIGTVEGYLVGLSLGLPLGSSIDSPNPVAELHGKLMNAPFGLWFVYDMVWC